VDVDLATVEGELAALWMASSRSSCRCRPRTYRRDLGVNDLNDMAVKGDGRRICAGKGDRNGYLGVQEAGFGHGNQDLAPERRFRRVSGLRTRSPNVATSRPTIGTS
jgi:hypothetical protein